MSGTATWLLAAAAIAGGIGRARRHVQGALCVRCLPRVCVASKRDSRVAVESQRGRCVQAAVCAHRVLGGLERARRPGCDRQVAV